MSENVQIVLAAAGTQLVLESHDRLLPAALHWGDDLGALDAATIDQMGVVAALPGVHNGMPGQGYRLSILPEQAQDHARRLAELGVQALDAPVSGGTLGAEAGTLAIMAGGEAADFERAREVLSVLGRPVHVGPAGSGQLTKLANQMIVGITIGAVAEALLLAEKGGANPAKVREALRGGFAALFLFCPDCIPKARF